MSRTEITRINFRRIVKATNKMPAPSRLSKSVVPLFPLRMADVPTNNQWLIEEDFLGFLLGNLMSFPILLTISFVPIEARALIKRVLAYRHDSSMR
jgi:hypothetical protein